ncbi:hypothetical protein FRC08_007870 [Ceratobasidium sp. 394]|nr:hypothetical protein FRC08_007870 [Ceratobasidium sp. 394]
MPKNTTHDKWEEHPKYSQQYTNRLTARESYQPVKLDEISYSNPNRVTDKGDRFKLHYGSKEGHENACPGDFMCRRSLATPLRVDK